VDVGFSITGAVFSVRVLQRSVYFWWWRAALVLKRPLHRIRVKNLNSFGRHVVQIYFATWSITQVWFRLAYAPVLVKMPELLPISK
jgi:hypothetical protein